jgi:hypothetical protein
MVVSGARLPIVGSSEQNPPCNHVRPCDRRAPTRHEQALAGPRR